MFLSSCHNPRVWQTDRRTERPWQYRALHYMQSHGKNGPQRHTVEMYASAIISFTHLYTYDLQLWTLTLKIIPAIPAHIMNNFDKFHWIPPLSTGWPKNGTVFWYALTSSNINRFFKLYHYQNQEKTCNNTVTKDPTTPQVCRYTTLWNVKCLQSNNWNQAASVTTFFKEINSLFPKVMHVVVHALIKFWVISFLRVVFSTSKTLSALTAFATR